MQTTIRPSRPDGEFPDAEQTLIVRERLMPRDWVSVHERHNAKVQVQIYVPEQDELGQVSDVTGWEAAFDLHSLGSTGCLVSARLARRQRPFPIQNRCQITIPLPEGDSIVVEGHIEHPDIRRKGETRLKISFRGLSASDLGKLSAYRDFLRDPPSVADEVTEIIPAPPAIPVGTRLRLAMAETRRRLPLALGLVLVAFSPSTAPVTSAPHNAARQPSIAGAASPEVGMIQAICRVRFADGVYFPKCGDTLEERKSTKLEFLPKNEQPAEGKGLTLKADLQFERGGRSCKTVIPVEFMKGETIEGSVHFMCDESPR